jgi:hypothetical protein
MDDQSIDSLIENFDISEGKDENRATLNPFTFWLPHAYKIKYDQIQMRSKRKFGKILKEVLKRSIDKVNLDDLDERAS